MLSFYPEQSMDRQVCKITFVLITVTHFLLEGLCAVYRIKSTKNVSALSKMYLCSFVTIVQNMFISKGKHSEF